MFRIFRVHSKNVKISNIYALHMKFRQYSEKKIGDAMEINGYHIFCCVQQNKLKCVKFDDDKIHLTAYSSYTKALVKLRLWRFKTD